MNWIKRIFGSAGAFLSQWFTSGKARADMERALDLVVKAGPIIDIAATIVTTLTPTGIDDALWNSLRAKYPALFDGSLKTSTDLKNFAFFIASDLLRAKYPALDDSIARAAISNGYLERRANDIPQAPLVPIVVK